METTHANDSLPSISEKPHACSARFALIIAFLALIAVSLTSWDNWRNARIIYQNLNNTAAVLSVLQQQVIKNDFVIRNNSKINSNLQTLLEQQQAALARIQQLSGNDHDDATVNEAHYLVQLAYYNLQFTKDINSALLLLQVADQKLAALSDPKLLNVRQLLAKNIESLQALPKLDLAGILSRLNALQLQMTQLPILMPSIKSTSVIKDESDNNLPAWRKALHHSWETLSRLIVIQKNNQAITPILATEQQAYLQQNLQLQLQQAQWAVLHGQQNVYITSLKQVQNWIQRYFAQNATVTQATLQGITELLQINVQPVLPDISKTLQAFKS